MYTTIIGRQPTVDTSQGSVSTVVSCNILQAAAEVSGITRTYIFFCVVIDQTCVNQHWGLSLCLCLCFSASTSSESVTPQVSGQQIQVMIVIQI